MQLTFYNYVIKKYAHKYLPANYLPIATRGRLASRYCMIMLSSAGKDWKLGPNHEVTDQLAFGFEQELNCMIEKIFDLYCLYETSGFQNIHMDGWINNSCPGCEYAGLCHSRDDMERNHALSQLDSYVYDPENYRHE